MPFHSQITRQGNNGLNNPNTRAQVSFRVEQRRGQFPGRGEVSSQAEERSAPRQRRGQLPGRAEERSVSRQSRGEVSFQAG